MTTPTPAEAALTSAVDAAISAYYQTEPDMRSMPAGWVILVQDINTDGDQTGVLIQYPNGWMPWATALGIVEMARIRLHAAFGSD